MAFTENLEVFLADFGVSCSAGAVSALGILDMPGQVLMDGAVVNTDYTLTARAVDFGSLLYGDSIVVNSDLYSVREVLLLDDGRMMQAGLQLVATASQAVYVPDVFQAGVYV
jgi:hypothetical protein